MKKKVTFGTAVLFATVYTGTGMGLHLLYFCALAGQPLGRGMLLNALASGLGLMTANLLVRGISRMVRKDR